MHLFISRKYLDTNSQRLESKFLFLIQSRSKCCLEYHFNKEYYTSLFKAINMVLFS